MFTVGFQRLYLLSKNNLLSNIYMSCFICLMYINKAKEKVYKWIRKIVCCHRYIANGQQLTSSEGCITSFRERWKYNFNNRNHECLRSQKKSRAGINRTEI